MHTYLHQCTPLQKINRALCVSILVSGKHTYNVIHYTSLQIITDLPTTGNQVAITMYQNLGISGMTKTEVYFKEFPTLY